MHRQFLGILLDIQHIAQRFTQADTGLRQPYRVQVSAEQIAIGQIQAWRGDLPTHHPLWSSEVILVMRAARGAVGEDQRRLPATPGAAAALGVIGRCRRHVTHVHYIKLGDVDSQLHRRRAIEQGQPALAKSFLTADPFLHRHLGRMLARSNPGQPLGHLPVELHEEGIADTASLWLTWHANRIVERRHPVTRLPDERSGARLVTGQLLTLADVGLAHRFHQ